MGLVHGGIPKELAQRIRDACCADVFIETGTYKGDTAAWAAGEFREVFTIEIDPALHAAAQKRLSAYANVTCLLGDCRATLESILPPLVGKRTLIWLDAHHCGNEDRDSPLLNEIELINKTIPDAAILIDDARFILAPVDGRRLCSLSALVRILDVSGWPREVVVIEDVIATVPAEAASELDAYCLEVTRADWDRQQEILKWKKTVPGRILKKLQSMAGCPCRM
jgi:hypothetical protein